MQQHSRLLHFACRHGRIVSQTDDRARPGTPGLSDFHPPGPPWGVRAGSVTEGRPVLWSPARVERPFSGSQHGRSVAWRRSAAAGERRGGGGQRREEKKRAVSVYRGPETQVLRAKCSNTRHGRIVSDRHGYPLVRFKCKSTGRSFDYQPLLGYGQAPHLTTSRVPSEYAHLRTHKAKSHIFVKI
jgi:hypothetical protein